MTHSTPRRGTARRSVRAYRAKGVWKKERAVRRKFSGGDEHRAPKAHTREQYWVGGYHRDGVYIKGHWRKNPFYR